MKIGCKDIIKKVKTSEYVKKMFVFLDNRPLLNYKTRSAYTFASPFPPFRNEPHCPL